MNDNTRSVLNGVFDWRAQAAGMIVGAILAVVLAMSGCATARVQPIPVAGGAGVGVNMVMDPQKAVAEDPGFWANNWGKVSVGSVAALATGWIGYKNDWFSGHHNETKVEAAPAAPTGNANVYINNSPGAVVNYGNTSSGE